MPDPTDGLTLDGLSVRYGATQAVRDVSLGVGAGRVLALIGPSGCGKTTILRAIAGLGPETSGRIAIAGRDVAGVPANKRNVGLVPQHYGLLPHLTVLDNVAYGLRARGVGKTAREQRARELLEMTQLSPLADRRPAELSGGQRQRVALARALAIEPDILLLDEPLAALDPQLRESIRQDLMRVVRRSGCTTVIVTHDQREALAVADEIAVLRAGELVQHGPAKDVWEAPRDSFVADFLSGALLFDASSASGDRLLLDEDWLVPRRLFTAGDTAGTLRILARPADLHLSTDPVVGSVEVPVLAREYAGGGWRVFVSRNGRAIRVDTVDDVAAADHHLFLSFVPGSARLLGGSHA